MGRRRNFTHQLKLIVPAPEDRCKTITQVASLVSRLDNNAYLLELIHDLF